MSSTSELQGLRIERPGLASATVARRHRWLSVGAPLLMALAFVVLVVWSGSELWLARSEVTVVPVATLDASTAVQAEGVLFKAPGWIEPMPTAIQVPALAEGIVERLVVVEGQVVQEGDPVATLIDTDTRLALRKIQAERDTRAAECKGAEAELKAAQLRYDNPVHLQASLAEAQSMLAQRKTELAKLPFLLQSAVSQKKFADESFYNKERAKEAISQRVLNQARLDFANAEVAVIEIERREQLLGDEVAALTSKVVALEKQFHLLVDETKELCTAKAQLEAALAKLSECDIAIEQAELKLARTQVRAPMAGRILRLLVQPGTRVMGLEATAGQNTSAVVSMYDPARLQVRVDVRLEDLARVQPGQKVLFETASQALPLEGRVLQITSSANIQKNTVEVKVLVKDPPDILRPEILVTATFVSTASESSYTSQEASVVCAMPRSLIDFTGESGTVWTVGPNGLAMQKQIRTASHAQGELVPVIEGLVPTDRLITSDRSRLVHGQPVKITGEDPHLGL